MNASDVIAIAAAVIAACALLATIWQASLTRSHNRLTVRPHLVSNVNRNADSSGAELTLVIKNCGIGPAIVKERSFLIAGKPFEAPPDAVDEVTAVFEAVLGSKHPCFLKRHGLPGVGAAIPPGGECLIASVHFSKYTIEMANAAIDSSEEIKFRLRYESLYGESFNLPED